MQITLNIPFKKYILLIKKFFKKKQIKKYSDKNNLKLNFEEIDGISETLVIFPEMDSKKIISGYLINRKT